MTTTIPRFRRRVRDLLAAAGHNQTWLARRLGVGPAAVTRILHGERSLPRTRVAVVEIARLLGISAAELVKDTELTEADLGQGDEVRQLRETVSALRGAVEVMRPHVPDGVVAAVEERLREDGLPPGWALTRHDSTRVVFADNEGRVAAFETTGPSCGTAALGRDADVKNAVARLRKHLSPDD